MGIFINRLVSSASLTETEVQNWFRENGITINDWSRENGFSPALVYAILKGRRKCLRGQSFLIAKTLGLKP